MTSDVHLPLYTALLGGGLIALQAGLMLTVGLYRGKAGQFLGVGDSRTLERLFRRHANLAENAGIFIAALAVLEILTGQTALVFWLAVAFAAARAAHVIAFSDLAGSHGVDRGGAKRMFVLCRMGGAMGTVATSVILGLSLIVASAGMV